MWFNSPGQQTGGMWGGNGPQAPQINNAPQGGVWGALIGNSQSVSPGGPGMAPQGTWFTQMGGQPSLQPLGGMGTERLLPNEGWQRMGSPNNFGLGPLAPHDGSIPGLPGYSMMPTPGWRGPGAVGHEGEGSMTLIGPNGQPVTGMPGGMSQPSGPREAPEAHPGMADQQAGQWAAPGGTLPIDPSGRDPANGGGVFATPSLGQWASALTARR